MKLEIKNDKLLKLIEAEANKNFISQEQLVKTILQDYFKDTEQPLAETFSLQKLREDAETLGTKISDMLLNFSSRYDVEASLVEDTSTYRVGFGNNYFVKVSI